MYQLELKDVEVYCKDSGRQVRLSGNQNNVRQPLSLLCLRDIISYLFLAWILHLCLSLCSR